MAESSTPEETAPQVIGPDDPRYPGGEDPLIEKLEEDEQEQDDRQSP